jgi:hypothetical protein
MNNMRFNTPRGFDGNSGGVTNINRTENVNIYVENFIGEDKWFEGMMDQYNMKVKPNLEKRRGREDRTVSIYF